MENQNYCRCNIDEVEAGNRGQSVSWQLVCKYSWHYSVARRQAVLPVGMDTCCRGNIDEVEADHRGHSVSCHI